MGLSEYMSFLYLIITVYFPSICLSSPAVSLDFLYLILGFCCWLVCRWVLGVCFLVSFWGFLRLNHHYWWFGFCCIFEGRCCLLKTTICGGFTFKLFCSVSLQCLWKNLGKDIRRCLFPHRTSTVLAGVKAPLQHFP